MSLALPNLPPFDPLTPVRAWGKGALEAFRIVDAQSGVMIFGGTGSGKTTGPGKYLALGYLAQGFGGLVLCAKKEEREHWLRWAKEAGRDRDIVVFDKSGSWRFNFLNWEAARTSEGGGITINIVALLDDISSAIASGAGQGDEHGGDNQFFRDALHHLNTNLVDLILLSELPVSLPLMRAIVNSAPHSLADIKSDTWHEKSTCAATLREADERTVQAGGEARADFEECRNYWLQEFPVLSEKTRSIVALSFSMLVRPFITRPLRKLFSVDTNITPEDAFAGKIIIVDLPVQEFRLAGRVASLAWKYCFQVAVLRRAQPTAKHQYLRPVFLWADEAQNFISDFDAEYQAVARSAGGCTVYLTQNRESLRRVLGNDDTVDSLLGNLQTKFFCQNSSVSTNKWASELFGERYVHVASINHGTSGAAEEAKANRSSGSSVSEHKRFFVEAAQFTVLKRGGGVHGNQVESIAYKGGQLFPLETEKGTRGVPFKIFTFNQ